MGSIARVFKKATKAVTKPISKAFKGVAKGIMKVGKATMRGVAKLNKKLGPLGSIALAIAMPYALGGLSTMTTAAMNSTNTFLRAIGFLNFLALCLVAFFILLVLNTNKIKLIATRVKMIKVIL